MGKIKVYTVEFFGQSRLNHMGIFVPNSSQEDVGTLYHVVGSAPQGFKKDIKKNYNLKESASYITNTKKFQFEIDELNLINTINNTPGYEPVSLKVAKSGKFKNCQTWVNEVFRSLK